MSFITSHLIGVQSTEREREEGWLGGKRDSSQEGFFKKNCRDYLGASGNSERKNVNNAIRQGKKYPIL